MKTTIRWKPSVMSAVHHGSSRPAGTQDDGVARHLLPADELVQGDLEAGHVGVVADELLALPRDDVDRARCLSVLGQAVHQGDDVLLVGDCHVGAQEVVATKFCDRLGEIDLAPVPQLVAGVDPKRVEGSLLHRSREGVGDRVADQDDSVGHARSLSNSLKKPG